MQTICKTNLSEQMVPCEECIINLGHIEAAVITLKAEGRLMFASLPYCSVNMTVIRMQAERGLEGTARTSWLSSPAALVDSCLAARRLTAAGQTEAAARR